LYWQEQLGTKDFKHRKEIKQRRKLFECQEDWAQRLQKIPKAMAFQTE
jgi:hypothetical protein